MTRSLLAAIVVNALSLAAPATAHPQAADPVHGAYGRFYAGDRQAAFEDLTALHAADAANLRKWFARLFAQHDLIEVDESLDASFERGIAEFLQAAERRYSRTHADSEALFYLAQAYLLRSTYRINYDKGTFGAARDAAKSKAYADAYVKLHPEHGDAYLALGLYNYYVAIAPNFVKVLRVLLFLPPGNRTEGLKQLERAARDGDLFAPLAEAVLADIYGTLEGRLVEAIRINEGLTRRFPKNADMRFELALRYMHPGVEAYEHAAEQYRAVLDNATGSSPEHLHARYRAIFGMAGLFRNRWRLEEATAFLSRVIDSDVKKPAWVMPSFLVRRANYRALLNDPGAADDARRVVRDKAMAASHKAAERQLAFIESRQKGNEAVVYAALLPGNRLVVERRWDEAAAAYGAVAAAYPNDWQVKYRLAYLQFARGNYEEAAREFRAIASVPTALPPWLTAAVLLNLGWTHDLAGRRAEALKVYRRIIDDYEDEAAATAARVGLISPYRRP